MLDKLQTLDVKVFFADNWSGCRVDFVCVVGSNEDSSAWWSGIIWAAVLVWGVLLEDLWFLGVYD
ncbi:MAG: hypothetical protein LBQ98_04860 [Nitrososphaerota archaeon]|jgi:hypothetical protein|nr:hypothetical protein [Nitrososphaerota archaeon]